MLSTRDEGAHQKEMTARHEQQSRNSEKRKTQAVNGIGGDPLREKTRAEDANANQGSDGEGRRRDELAVELGKKPFSLQS